MCFSRIYRWVKKNFKKIEKGYFILKAALDFQKEEYKN